MVADLKEKFNIFEYVNVDLLIIDDIGKEKGTDWVCEQIYTIINKRYEKMLPTVLTTESTMDVLRHGCYLLKSGHGDRRIRDVREYLPKGYTMREESHQMRNGKRVTSFKRFHLEKVDNIVQAPFGDDYRKASGER